MKIVDENIDINDIYMGQGFNVDSINKYGEINIDHYVPWGFVLHNELWNLIPTFKNINSSKGNNIRNKNKYLDEC